MNETMEVSRVLDFDTGKEDDEGDDEPIPPLLFHQQLSILIVVLVHLLLCGKDSSVTNVSIILSFTGRYSSRPHYHRQAD